MASCETIRRTTVDESNHHGIILLNHLSLPLCRFLQQQEKHKKYIFIFYDPFIVRGCGIKSIHDAMYSLPPLYSKQLARGSLVHSCPWVGARGERPRLALALARGAALPVGGLAAVRELYAYV